MPNPVGGSLFVNSLLTDQSVGWIQSSTNFAARRVFPVHGVQQQSGIIPRYDRGDLYRIEAERRAAGANANRVGFRTDNTQTYRAEEWALEFPIDDHMRANATNPYDPEMDGTRFLTQQMLLRQEEQFVTNFFSTGNLWTGSSDAQDLVGGTDFTQWSNAASTPIEDVDQWKQTVESKTGFLPNKLVVNRKLWFDLKNHPDVVDRVKAGGNNATPARVSQRALAELMELDEVVVAAGVQNTGAEGDNSTAADSFSYLAGDHALLVYTPERTGLWQPAAGVTYAWNGLIAGARDGVAVDTYSEDRSISDIVRMRSAYDMKIVASELGVLFASASTN